MLNRGASEDPADPGLNRVLAAAARHKLPVNLLCGGRLEQEGVLADRNPDTQIVIDHLGLQQPFEPPAPPEPFADLPKIVALAARCARTAVLSIMTTSGACAQLAGRQDARGPVNACVPRINDSGC